MSQTPYSAETAPGSPGVPVGDVTRKVVDQAQGTISQVVDQAQGAAGQVTNQATQQATSQLESQKKRAVDSLVTVAQALRQTGQHLHEQEQGAVGGYVDQAAERVEALTNHLRTRDVPQLVTETQQFARRQPGLFLGGAVALGFIGARFLMSSGQRAGRREPASFSPSYTPGYGAVGASSLREPGWAGAGAVTPSMGYASAEVPPSGIPNTLDQ